MKLINQFTIWYLGISIIVFLIGGILIFYKMESEIDFEQGQELERQLDRYARKMETLENPGSLQKDRLEITELPADQAMVRFHISDTLAWHEPLEQVERQVKAGKSYLVNGRHFYMSTYNIMIESDDITETVVQTMVAIFLMLLVFIVVTSRLVSKRILQPFHQSLDKIRTFNFKDNQPLVFESTRTEEFEKLHDFLNKMSVRLLSDYKIVKEFSENLSHEIQTPIAVASGKLELLLNSPIDKQQANWIGAAYRANEKMTKIVNSLATLAKLENQEFEGTQSINFSSLVTDCLHEYEELMGMKKITVHQRIKPSVKIDMHAHMAEMLVDNLLNNAIKHNTSPGQICLELNNKVLKISNKGARPTGNVTEYLKRFKKGNPSSESIGLGLSIIQQICRIHGYTLEYTFINEEHQITIQLQN
ncbi:Signal transduction histidine kinase [Cyclobacterium lianum]|uniref:histidine kinase n=1 Tax=Cyclobacterium lianum TaxID=388280 RepID=A0A1M7Q9K9_9BACT|nr:HAMP domain-containing sensor histidine kinase [Cyclobacterium lianum]SHN27358.1 Signal transduction histidine kinase [Cyclobacterium lianum]